MGKKNAETPNYFSQGGKKEEANRIYCFIYNSTMTNGNLVKLKKEDWKCYGGNFKHYN
jgi:hypothetical protein